MQVLLTTTRAWYLDKTAKAFLERKALAGLWMADKNLSSLPPDKYRRCWPYHLCLKPFYHCTSQIWSERATYFFLHVYTRWLRAQLMSKNCPKFNVVHAIMGFGTELFDHADRVGALKVIDAPNSHPTTYYGYWQRECDLWCPGENVPIPRYMFSRMNRELSRADVVIAQSDFCKESMVANGIPADKIIVNLMGVDTSLFRKRETVPKKIRFVCVGTICLRKGHQYLFRAFQLVKQRLPDAELICVGDYKCDFRKERPKWENTFTHHPILTHPELAKLLRSCTAFVFPSREEGIARAQIEGMACSLPCIGTHEAGTTTLIKDGESGFIVNGSDPQQIANAMISLALDPELNQRMGESAFNRGGEGNTWQDYGDRLLAAYQVALDHKHRVAA